MTTINFITKLYKKKKKGGKTQKKKKKSFENKFSNTRKPVEETKALKQQTK